MNSSTLAISLSGILSLLNRTHFCFHKETKTSANLSTTVDCPINSIRDLLSSPFLFYASFAWSILSKMAVERRHARALNYDFGRGPLTVIDLEIDEDYDSDVTLPDESVDRGPITPLPNSNPEPELDAMFRPLPTLFSSSMNLRIGKTVELRDGDFLRITEISENRITKQPLLRGLRYRRNSKTHGMLDKHLNEVTLILKHNESDRRHIMKQSMESIIPSAVVKIRSLIESNLPYPTLSYCEAGMPNSSISDIWNNGTLVCRWKLLDHGKNEGVLQMLECNDCDDNHCTDSEALKISFRDETIKGGLSLDWLPGERQYDIQERERCNYNDPLNFHPPFELFDLTTVANGVDPTLKRYTIGDGFCGAGGISRGAKAAGLKVVWGFDFDTAAIESFSLNFSGAYCWAIAAHDLITVITDDLKVDILHLSPPCQTFSPAHTKPGKDDEMNQATFFATRELIKRTKPRIVTLEETFGLIRTENNLRWFKAMVQMFTSLGFSLRWKVFDLRNFGLPQPRRRLFLYASW